MRLRQSFIGFILVASALATSCGDDKNSGDHTDSIGDTLGEISMDQTRLKFQRLLRSIPIPFRTLEQLNKAQLPFRSELLNPETNAGNYSVAQVQALNLGIYGADLAYLISQDKLGEAGPYLKQVKQLADQVVVPTAFDESTMRGFSSAMSMENNADATRQKDMQQMMYSSYDRIDSTLCTNDRLELATLVVAGGWIESLYLTTQYLGDDRPKHNSEVLYDILREQRKHLPSLIALLADFESNPRLKQLHDDLLALKTLYPETNTLSSEQQKQVRESIQEIRNKCIKS